MMAERSHLFPSRTQKLSSPAPMVLGPQGPGRVGRREATIKRLDPLRIGSFFVVRAMVTKTLQLRIEQDRRDYEEQMEHCEFESLGLLICLRLFGAYSIAERHLVVR